MHGIIHPYIIIIIDNIYLFIIELMIITLKGLHINMEANL